MTYALPTTLQFKRWPASAREMAWVTAVVLLALMPHVSHLPFWIPLIVVSSLLWRVILEVRAAALPGKWIRNGIAIMAMLSVLLAFHTFNGLEAGTALLSIMVGMKLLETRDHRDYTILIFIALFLLFAELLYDQSMTMLPYLFISTLLSTATLLRLHDGGAHISYGDALKRCARMLLQALPLAVLLFIFFPRLSGQFWALPSRGGATSGLSDEMNPGDVSNLSLSDEVAFRVEFSGDLPPESQRYWRAIVLHDFDGRTWRRAHGEFITSQPVHGIGNVYDYRLLLEPDNQRWIPVLDVPLQWNLRRSFLLSDLQLIASEPIAQLTAVNVRSATHYQYGEKLSVNTRRMETRLPGSLNPRTRELAQTMRSQAGDDSSYINAVLRMFNQQDFSYTLEPPRLGINAVDDFLFNTRSGFCEHYASAFTMLMRAAGIPARVVTGYQGGEYNSLGSYLIVRQSDAHAWSEVWLAERGWVRIDPTAAIAPERINNGLQSAMAANEPVPGRLLRQSKLLNSLRMSLDAINTYWKERIIQFDTNSQQALLGKLGFDSTDWRSLGLAMVMTFVLFFFGMLLYLTWRFKPRQHDPVVQLYMKLQRKLENYKITRESHEGPSDFLKRAMSLLPSKANELKNIRRFYINLRYETDADSLTLSKLKALVKNF